MLATTELNQLTVYDVVQTSSTYTVKRFLHIDAEGVLLAVLLLKQDLQWLLIVLEYFYIVAGTFASVNDLITSHTTAQQRKTRTQPTFFHLFGFNRIDSLL